jgi:hypothetical protein
VAVAQLAERRDVAPEVAGSNPVGHPTTPPALDLEFALGRMERHD